MVCRSGSATLAPPTGTESAQTDLERIPLERPARCISSDADLERVRQKLTKDEMLGGPALTSPSLPKPQQDSTAILNAFTVDVEDYFQVSAFEKHIHRDQWDRWESRVEANTYRILQLLDRHGVKATFFVLGWVGNRYPQLVRDIHACGHEIGSHGYWHRLIYEETPEEFRADLRRSRDVLQEAIGQRVTAHRAASFSITKQSLWALEILVEEGFLVDSSVFPIRHHRYGIPGAEPRLHRLSTPAGPLWEFPPSVVRFAGLNVPVSGGGYFRLYPLAWTLYCLRRLNQAQRQPVVFYTHPWELDPEQPRIRAASWLSRFRHYVNLGTTARKLETLLRRFRFGTLGEVVARAAGREAEAVPPPARAVSAGSTCPGDRAPTTSPSPATQSIHLASEHADLR